MKHTTATPQELSLQKKNSIALKQASLDLIESNQEAYDLVMMLEQNGF